MLKLVKPKKTNIKEVEFAKPFLNQKLGLEMLITLNATDKDFLIAPEVGKQVRIVVIKDKPNYLFNPVLEYKDEDNIKDFVKFTDYLGNHKRIDMTPLLETAVKSLEPTKRKSKKKTARKKTNANKS